MVFIPTLFFKTLESKVAATFFTDVSSESRKLVTRDLSLDNKVRAIKVKLTSYTQLVNESSVLFTKIEPIHSLIGCQMGHRIKLRYLTLR